MCKIVFVRTSSNYILPTLIIFGTNMAKWIELYEVHSFSLYLIRINALYRVKRSESLKIKIQAINRTRTSHSLFGVGQLATKILVQNPAIQQSSNPHTLSADAIFSNQSPRSAGIFYERRVADFICYIVIILKASSSYKLSSWIRSFWFDMTCKPAFTIKLY